MRLVSRLRSAFPLAAVGAGGGARRPGYDASTNETMGRVRPMLESERVVWLSTVRPDGLPHLVPTWFWWDGEALLVFSKPGAVKVRNLRSNPRVMVALGRPEADFSVGLIEARATCAPGTAAIPEAFFGKYEHDLAAGDLDRATFVATYTQLVRIIPTRFVPWRGRGTRHEPRRMAESSRGDAVAMLPAWA